MEVTLEKLAYQELVEHMDRERMVRAYGTLGFLKLWRAYFRRSGRAFLKGGGNVTLCRFTSKFSVT